MTVVPDNWGLITTDKWQSSITDTALRVCQRQLRVNPFFSQLHASCHTLQLYAHAGKVGILPLC